MAVGDSLAELKVKIDTDTKGLQTGLKGAETRMGKFSKGIQKHSKAIGIGMAAMGAAIVGAAVLSVKSWAAMGDEIAKMARKTGMSTEALSELRHAAMLSGGNLATVEKAIKRMSKAISDANDGMATYLRAFEKVGINAADLAGMKPEEAFMKIATAIADVEDPLLRAAVAQDLFGRAGMDLIPMFDMGSEAIREMREEAHKLGIVFDAEMAKSAEDVTDAMHRTTQATQGLKNAIAVALAPQIEETMKKVEEFVVKLIDWTKANPELVATIVKAGGIVAALGILLISLNMIIGALRGVAIALAVVHAFLGPAGWAKLALGLALAAAATVGIMQLIKIPGQQPGIKFGGPGLMPENFQAGGIVRRPTLAMVGERGPEAIVPLRGGMMGGNVFNFTGPFMGNEEEASDFAEQVLAKIRQSQSFRTTGLTA